MTTPRFLLQFSTCLLFIAALFTFIVGTVIVRCAYVHDFGDRPRLASSAARAGHRKRIDGVVSSAAPMLGLPLPALCSNHFRGPRSFGRCYLYPAGVDRMDDCTPRHFVPEGRPH